MRNILSGPKQFQPAGSSVIETVDGDLDGDKIPEKVIIYNKRIRLIWETSVKFRF